MIYRIFWVSSGRKAPLFCFHLHFYELSILLCSLSLSCFFSHWDYFCIVSFGFSKSKWTQAHAVLSSFSSSSFASLTAFLPLVSGSFSLWLRFRFILVLHSFWPHFVFAFGPCLLLFCQFRFWQLHKIKQSRNKFRSSSFSLALSLSLFLFIQVLSRKVFAARSECVIFLSLCL